MLRLLLPVLGLVRQEIEVHDAGRLSWNTPSANYSTKHLYYSYSVHGVEPRPPIAASPACDTLKTQAGDTADAMVKELCQLWPGTFPDKFVNGAGYLYDLVYSPGGLLKTAKAAMAAEKAKKEFCWLRFQGRPEADDSWSAQHVCPAYVSGHPLEVAAGTYGVVMAPARSLMPQVSVWPPLGAVWCWKDCLDVCGTTEPKYATTFGPWCACGTNLTPTEAITLRNSPSFAFWSHTYPRTAPAEWAHCPVGAERIRGDCYDECPAEEQPLRLDSAMCRNQCHGSLPVDCGLSCAESEAACFDAVTDQVEGAVSGATEIAVAVLEAMGFAGRAQVGEAIDTGIVQTFHLFRVAGQAVQKAHGGGASHVVGAVLVALAKDLVVESHGDLWKMKDWVEHYVGNIANVFEGTVPLKDAVKATLLQRLDVVGLEAIKGPEKIFEAFYAPVCAKPGDKAWLPTPASSRTTGSETGSATTPSETTDQGIAWTRPHTVWDRLDQIN